MLVSLPVLWNELLFLLHVEIVYMQSILRVFLPSSPQPLLPSFSPLASFLTSLSFSPDSFPFVFASLSPVSPPCLFPFLFAPPLFFPVTEAGVGVE